MMIDRCGEIATMPYLPPDPSLDKEYDEITALSGRTDDPEALKALANKLALKIRSRCIDLATWQADYSPEYKKREAQCRVLAALAGSAAHPFLVREFGSAS